MLLRLVAQQLALAAQMQPELDLVGLLGPKSGRNIRLPFQRVDERQRVAGGLRGTGLGMWPRDKSRVAHQRDAAHCHPAHRIPDRRCGQVETFRARWGGEARGPGLNQKSPEMPLNGIAHFNFLDRSNGTAAPWASRLE
jgi:hypothetical protein